MAVSLLSGCTSFPDFDEYDLSLGAFEGAPLLCPDSPMHAPLACLIACPIACPTTCQSPRSLANP